MSRGCRSTAGWSVDVLVDGRVVLFGPCLRFGGGGGGCSSIACFRRFTWSDRWIRVPTFGGRGCGGGAGAGGGCSGLGCGGKASSQYPGSPRSSLIASMMSIGSDIVLANESVDLSL